jgi:uncharacterized membrane protein YidH (DUF202 family)
VKNIISFLIVGSIFLIAGILTERFLKKKYAIAKNEGWIYHPVNNFQTYTEIILSIILIVSIYFLDNLGMMFFVYFSVLNSFRAFMEWKYERETKRYLLSLFSAIYFIIFIGVLIVARILPIH